MLGNDIDLDANGGSIGNPAGGNDLEIDSFRGSFCMLFDNGITLSCEVRRGARGRPQHLPDRDRRRAQPVLAHALANIRLTVRESTDLDEHLNLLRDGGALFFEDPPTGRAPCSKGPDVREGRVRTAACRRQRHARPAERDPGRDRIDIYGDYANADLNFASTANVDPGFGTKMILRGRIIAGCIVVQRRSAAPSTPPTRSISREVWGYNDVDTHRVRRSLRHPFGTTPGDPGYIFIGSKTLVHGGQPTPPGTWRRSSSPTARTTRRLVSPVGRRAGRARRVAGVAPVTA